MKRKLVTTIVAELEKLRVSDERREAPQGLERSLVAQAAERAERQGGVEDSREGKRVAPVKATKGRPLIHSMPLPEIVEGRMVTVIHRFEVRLLAQDGIWAMVRRPGCMPYVCHHKQLSPVGKPESGADAPASPPTGQTATEANP